MMAVVFAIITMVSFINLKAMGIKVAAGTWTSYVKDVGIILSEELERERRDPANKYWLTQWDESVMRKRKNSK